MRKIFRHRSASMEDDWIMDMKIDDYILTNSPTPLEPLNDPPKSPVLVFINGKSGGQLGTQLLTSYRVLLNYLQVFDLGEKEPDKELHRILGHLEMLKDSDPYADSVRTNLKIIVGGGDGTASWLLGVVGDLKLSHPPPIATIPLGTGNNLPYAFGWGKKNPFTDVESVKSFLLQVRTAKPMNIDSWHVVMSMKTSTSMEPVQLPYSLHPFNLVSDANALHQDGYQIFRGGFWNYFSMGMDAQVSYEFHKKRHEHPELFKNQFMNQGTYAMLGVTQGWFVPSAVHPGSKTINELASIKVAQMDGKYKRLQVSSRIRSIVMLNLPSFSGGLNPWGDPNKDRRHSRRHDKELFTPLFVNDGLIELVGFRDAWQGLALLGPNGHGTRLAQAHKVKIKFQHDAADHTYMRLDGEPWIQPLTKNGGHTVIEITRLGQAVMLSTDNCSARCVDHDPGKVSTSCASMPAPPATDEVSDSETEVYNNGQYDSSDSEGSEGSESSSKSEARRKFGAAETFRHDSNSFISDAKS